MASIADSDPTSSRRPAHGWVPLLERAEQLGELCWIETALFAALGRWSATTEDPTWTVRFGAASRRHGWHAEQVFARLPELSVLDTDELVRPPGPGTVALLDEVAALEALPARVAAHRAVVLPRLAARVEAMAATCSPVADGSVARTLSLLLADVRGELDEAPEGAASTPGDEQLAAIEQLGSASGELDR